MNRDHLYQWSPDFDELAMLVARCLSGDSHASAQVVMPGSVWNLGQVQVGNASYKAYLVRLTTESTVHTLRRYLDEPNVITATIGTPPALGKWPDPSSVAISLTEILELRTSGLRCNHQTIEQALVNQPCGGPWHTVTDAAKLLMHDLPYIDLKLARARVSMACSRNQFISNNKKGTQRRIEPSSFDAWRLKQRNASLDVEE